MAAAVRTITLADVTDGTELIAELVLSDDELAAQGILLSDDGYMSGGPTTSRFVEARTGEQFCLVRFEYRPEWLSVWGQLTRDATDSLNVLMDGLRIPRERITWQIPDDDWANLQQGYNRSRWLRRKAEWLKEDNDS